MIGSVPSKLAQLAVLPSVLVVAALTVPARHPSAPRHAPGSTAPADAPFFAAGAPPAGALDLARAPRATDVAPAGAWFQVTVVATWPDAAACDRAASAVRSLLATSARHHEDPGNAAARARLLDDESAAPVTPGEAVEFGRLGVSSAIGVGWPGKSADASDAVLVYGRVLAVAGLKGDFAGLRPNPLVALLERLGARVFVEGDPAASRPPIFDITFVAPDAAALTRLGGALTHHFTIRALHLRPPWHPAGLSADETRARATYADLESLVDHATAELPPPGVGPWRSPEQMKAAAARYHGELRRAALEAIDFVESEGGHDQVVVDEYRRGVATSVYPIGGHPADLATHRRLVERLGPLAVEMSAQGAAPQLVPTAAELAHGAVGRVQVHVDARRLELGGVLFHRVACGLPGLLDWLRRARCTDVRLDVTGADRPREPVERD